MVELVSVSYPNNKEEIMNSFFVTYKRRKYEFKVTTSGFISPITGEVLCTPGFPVANPISLEKALGLYKAAEKILFEHIEMFIDDIITKGLYKNSGILPV